MILANVWWFAGDDAFFSSLRSSFVVRGTDVLYWSNRLSSSALPLIPLISSRSERNRYYKRHLRHEHCYNREDMLLFAEELQAVQHKYKRDFLWHDPKLILPFVHSLFTTLKPSLYVAWAGSEPRFHAALHVARRMGISTAVMENGMFRGTKLIDRGGLAGLSEPAGIPLETLVPQTNNEDYRIVGSNFLRQYEKSFTPLYSSVQLDHLRQRKSTDKPLVLVLGCFDFALGLHFSSSDKKAATLPGFDSGLDIALKVADANLGITIFKAHPGEPQPADVRADLASDSFIVAEQDEDVVSLIRQADVIVGYGSTLDYLALAMGKPLVLCGHGPLAGKGCAYEALQPSRLNSAIEMALAREGFSEMIERFQLFAGFLLRHYLYSSSDKIPAQNVEAAATKLLSFVKPGGPPNSEDAWSARKLVLSAKGRLLLPLDQTIRSLRVRSQAKC